MSSTPSLNPYQLNAAQRAAVLSQAVEMKQQIFSQTIAAPANGNVINIPVRNVGLIKRFYVEVTGTATNTDGAADANLTDLGLANLLSQVTFTDLNNNVRVQTAGWHLHLLNSAKYQQNLGSALLAASVFEIGNFGNNFSVLQATNPLVHGSGGKTVRAIFEVPLAYSDDDLRGAVYANVVNATMNLQLTLNTQNFCTPTGADSTLAVYTGVATANVALTNVTITVYQVYLDQLPVSNGKVVLPVVDLSTVYEIKNTTFTAFAAAQDNPIAYANFRDFLSTIAIYNHDSSANAGRTSGSDINYIALQSANFTNLWKVTPEIAAFETRKLLGQDLPPGCYYFSHRRKPISTTTYGNMELIINPSSAAAQNYTLVGWEDFAVTNTLAGAGSLAG